MKKTMKKLMVLIMTMMMGMSLVACGGADKQPAIDAFNKTSTSFNEVANIINENPQAYDQDLVDTMVDMAIWFSLLEMLFILSVSSRSSGISNFTTYPSITILRI